MIELENVRVVFIQREDEDGLSLSYAMKVWEEGKNFLDELKSDSDVTSYIKPTDIEALFDLGYHTKHVDTIFNSVFKK